MRNPHWGEELSTTDKVLFPPRSQVPLVWVWGGTTVTSFHIFLSMDRTSEWRITWSVGRDQGLWEQVQRKLMVHSKVLPTDWELLAQGGAPSGVLDLGLCLCGLDSNESVRQCDTIPTKQTPCYMPTPSCACAHTHAGSHTHIKTHAHTATQNRYAKFNAAKKNSRR